MTLRAFFFWLLTDPKVNVVAKAFLVGFGGNALWMVLGSGFALTGNGFDLGAFLPHLTDRIWWYLFFNESFKMGSSAAFGYLGINHFSRTSGTVTVLTRVDMPPSSKP